MTARRASACCAVVALLCAGCFSSPPRRQASTTSTQPSPTAASQMTMAVAGQGAVPEGFSAVSVTFVSLRTGWVLGTAPCPIPPCTTLLRTNDGGRTWVQIPAPPAPVSEGYADGVRRIRFANADDGWAFLPDLWATHDGGAHWKRLMGGVLALETASGLAHLVGGSGGGTGFAIQTSPVQSDDWRASPTTVPVGAGPVPEGQLVLHGKAGWVVVVNRTVTGGARLEGGRWVPWRPPCAEAGGGVALAASSSVDLVAICHEGVWTDRPRAERAYVSADGGSTFHDVATLPIEASAVASPARSVFVLAGFASDTAVLMATADAGRTWKTVARQGVGDSWADLGFTSPRQGVVIRQGEVGRLLMTLDGGTIWKPVPFR